MNSLIHGMQFSEDMAIADDAPAFQGSDGNPSFYGPIFSTQWAKNA